MPNPYNNKIQLADGTVLLDLSTDTLSSADQLMQGVTAHDRTGAVITGTGSGGGITPTGNINITQAGTTDVTNYATATVASGSATASATKGTVSNHSVTVTPSVTRTAGYVTAGSANGTAISVSASELVSGTYNITTSGTHDVTNYASASVTFSAIYTGSSDPPSTLGNDGDIYLKLV